MSPMRDSTPTPAENSNDLPVSGGIVRPRRRIFVSTSSLFASNLLMAALGALALKLMTHRLGPDSYGIFVTATTVVSTSEFLTDLGVNSVTGREIARNPKDAEKVLSFNLGLRLSLSAVLIPFVWVIGDLVYRASPEDVRFGIAIVAITVPFDAIRAVSVGYFVSSISNHWTAAINLFQQVLWVSGLAFALSVGAGVRGCFYAYLGSMVILAAVSYGLVYRQVRFRPRFSVRNWVRIIRQSISIGLIQIIGVVYLRADIILLSVMTSVYQVAIYGLAYAFITFFEFFSSAFMTSMLPVMTRSRPEELKPAIEWAVSYMAMANCLIAAGVICIGPAVVRLVSSNKFGSAATPLSILAVSLVFSSLRNIFGFACFSRDRHQKLVPVTIAALVLNVILNLIAIPRWGVNGSAGATVVSEAFALMAYYLVFRHAVGVRVAFVRRLVRPLAAAGVAVVVFRVCLWSPHATASMALLVGLGVTGLFLAVLAILRGLPPDFRVAGRRALDALLGRES